MNHEGLCQKARHAMRCTFLAAFIVALMGPDCLAANHAPKKPARQAQQKNLEPVKAYVPDPKPFNIEDLEVPDWYQLSYRNPPIRFQTDLDLLAPMGTGSQNAARFFRLFSKPDGSRLTEFNRINASKVNHSDWGDILPANEPLIEEAKLWADQSVMRFYPDYYTLNGSFTAIPNLLLPFLLARTWTAMGVDSPNKSVGLGLCRRAIRLGRLLRQEDVCTIADAIGVLCIQTGTKGIYKIALSEGNTKLAFLASIVLGEVAPQNILMRRKFDKSTYLGVPKENDNQEKKLLISERDLEDLITIAKEDPCRRFRMQAIFQMNFIRHLCDSKECIQKVVTALSKLLKSNDPMISQSAQWSLEYTISKSDLKDYLNSYYP